MNFFDTGLLPVALDIIYGPLSGGPVAPPCCSCWCCWSSSSCWLSTSPGGNDSSSGVPINDLFRRCLL